MATEIIVYRNPMEKAMWDFWFQNPTFGYVVSLFLFALIGFMMIYVVNAMLGNPWDKIVRRVKYRKHRGSWEAY